jgi:hypothetical protein
VRGQQLGSFTQRCQQLERKGQFSGGCFARFYPHQKPGDARRNAESLTECAIGCHYLSISVTGAGFLFVLGNSLKNFSSGRLCFQQFNSRTLGFK